MDMNEIYLEKYIGEKEYGKFEGRWKFCRKAHGFGFNPFAFLLGPLYLFYKKIYREGVAFLVFTLTASLVIGMAAGIFAMGVDDSGFASYDYGLTFKEDFSYFDLTPAEICRELAKPPLGVYMTESACIYGRTDFPAGLSEFEVFILPLTNGRFHYSIESLPVFAFWSARITANLIMYLLLALRFDMLYYKKVSRLAAGQLCRIKESAAADTREKILKRAYGEIPCHPLYILMGLTFFGILYPLPLRSFDVVYAGVFLLLFPVFSAADYIFGDKNVRFE